MTNKRTVYGQGNDAVEVKLTDIGNGLHAEQIDAVGPIQLGFLKGEQFRSFYRLNIAPNDKIFVRAVVPLNTVLLDFNVDLKSGGLDIRTLLGGTPSDEATWNVSLPLIPCNSMTEVPLPAPTPQVTLKTGGTLTGTPTERDFFFSQTGGGSGNQQKQAVGKGQNDIRGVPAAIFYFEFAAYGAENAIGVMHMTWWERPSN